MSPRAQEQIAEAVGIPRRTIADSFGGFGNIADLAKPDAAAADHATDFEPPIYNIWRQQDKTAGAPC